MTLVDIFGDIEGLDLELTKEDFAPDDPKNELAEFAEENKHLRDYLRKKGGRLSCHTLNYL
jgi:hypothetical protein